MTAKRRERRGCGSFARPCPHVSRPPQPGPVCRTRVPPHLLQARGLVVHVFGQQDEHAEVLVLEGELYDLAADAVDVAQAERGLQAHHLHWLGVRL